MIKGKKVYDPLTDTLSTGYWVADDKRNYYPVWQKGVGMERLTESNPSWIDDELWESACEPDCEEIDAVYRKLKDYEDLEEQGRLIILPCKVGDTVYVDNTILPIEDMECYEDIDNKIPLYFPARVVSFRFAKRNWMKIAVKAKWLHEWIDDETGPESDYIECEKNFTILLSMIGKTVFLTQSAAEEKLKELRQ